MELELALDCMVTNLCQTHWIVYCCLCDSVDRWVIGMTVLSLTDGQTMVNMILLVRLRWDARVEHNGIYG